MAQSTILLVDDEKEIIDMLEIYLKNEGYKLLRASDGEQALQVLQKEEVDLIVLDIMMPKMDGIEACLKIREQKNMPIIMLSAKSQDMDKIWGLSSGADDYLSKPFNSLELIARIKSQLRRYTRLNVPHVNKEHEIEVDDLMINTLTHEVKVQGQEVKLTPREFAILELLARNRGMVWNIEKIYEAVWKEAYFDSEAHNLARELDPPYLHSGDVPEEDRPTPASRQADFEEHVKRIAQNQRYKVLITDLEGRVIFRSSNAAETNVDIHNVINNAMNARTDSDYDRKEFSSFYPVNYKGQKSYLVVSGIPQPHITYRKGDSPMSILSAIAMFIFLFYFLTQRKMRYVEELAGGLRIIATGNLDYRVIERSEDELGSLARDMNLMVEDLQRRIEEERRNEQLKNELITNVSHDLRTPLTLIMGYLRLLHDKGYETPEQAAGYVSIAYNKSEKLKLLIDDLFEYTKLSNRDVPLYKEGVPINDVLDQLLEEFVTMAEEQQLAIIRNIPKEKLLVRIDVDKMIRVFENLLTNALKYSLKPGAITVNVSRDHRYVTIRVSNRSDMLTDEELQQLFERFYRVDASRTSSTGGSGLGLAIAKSIVDSHDGTIWAEQDSGQLHFYVKLKLAALSI
ncbi:ATP-binding response regulator [Paenibacillus sp. UNC451MF]|uniref:ATP-binding response regulator n=1 Tax=Paenibacillus sp. UNC451MF TaxID=1449063 RepID=UPI0009DD5D2A|nr:response regulator [Paenibacillus sp. UNC451MF]